MSKKNIALTALVLLVGFIIVLFALKPKNTENAMKDQSTMAEKTLAPRDDTSAAMETSPIASNTSDNSEPLQQKNNPANPAQKGDDVATKHASKDELAPNTITTQAGRFTLSAPDIADADILATQNSEQLMLAICSNKPDVLASAIAEYKEEYDLLLGSFGITKQCSNNTCSYKVANGALQQAFAKSGLSVGDTITHINNMSVQEIDSLETFLSFFNLASANSLTVINTAGSNQVIALDCYKPELKTLPEFTPKTFASYN